MKGTSLSKKGCRGKILPKEKKKKPTKLFYKEKGYFQPVTSQNLLTSKKVKKIKKPATQRPIMEGADRKGKSFRGRFITARAVETKD